MQILLQLPGVARCACHAYHDWLLFQLLHPLLLLLLLKSRHAVCSRPTPSSCQRCCCCQWCQVRRGRGMWCPARANTARPSATNTERTTAWRRRWQKFANAIIADAEHILVMAGGSEPWVAGRQGKRQQAVKQLSMCALHKFTVRIGPQRTWNC